jgi:hypothetical protein
MNVFSFCRREDGKRKLLSPTERGTPDAVHNGWTQMAHSNCAKFHSPRGWLFLLSAVSAESKKYKTSATSAAQR